MSKVQQLFSGTKKRNKVLEQIPMRVMTLMKGINGNKDISDRMMAAGYTPDVQDNGFRLLEHATGYRLKSVGAMTGLALPSVDAITAVSDWFVPSFSRIEAALTHLHPAQADYVLHGLANVSGIASVVAATVLLDRIDDLAGKGTGAGARTASADDDKKALATLALRGFDEKELAHARALTDTAHTAMSSGSPVVVDEDEQEKRLLALKAWFDDWAETAHAVLPTRADLIKIGLAHRRVPSPAAPVGAPAAPAPAPAADGGVVPPAVTPHA